MNRRILRKIALLLVAAQILGAPANAFPGLAPAGDAAHCADAMPASHDDDRCPCCPDGGMNASACLSACTVSVGWVPVLAFTAAPATTDRVIAAPPARLVALAEPPLKPPPIA